MELRKKRTLYLISAVAALAGLLFGFDTGVISGAILFINQDFSLTHTETEFVVSSVLFGALLGASCRGRLCDKLGRKTIIIITAMIFTVGTLISALSIGILSMVFGRVVLGLAIGVASFAAPLYLAELAPKNKRGFLVSLNQLAITLGILGSYLIDYYWSSEGAWRMMLLSGIVPSLLLLLGMCLLPESPRFLLLKGKKSTAKKILNKIRPSHEVDFEIDAILKTQHQKSHWRDLFINKKVSRIFGHCCSLILGDQFNR